MKNLPDTENPLVLRTDFSNNAAWEKITAELQEPDEEMGFTANVECVDDAAYDRVTTEQILEHVPEGYPHAFMFVVDQTTISQPDHPLLILDLIEEPGREFRAIPSTIQSIENNLSIANMGFEEFAENVDADGIFRGFPEA
jgi:hypothetical protein